MADELARASVTDLPFQFSTSTPQVVFTGLTLTAGTYYVIEASDVGSPGASWGGPITPVDTTAPGVTINPILQAESLAGYSPASDFVADSDFQLAFSVTGSPVPEPLNLGDDAHWLRRLGLCGISFGPRASISYSVKPVRMRLMKAAVRRPFLLNLDYRQQFVSIPADAFTASAMTISSGRSLL